MEAAIEAGADDVQSDDDEHIVLTAANELGTVANTLRAARPARSFRKNSFPFPRTPASSPIPPSPARFSSSTTCSTTTRTR